MEKHKLRVKYHIVILDLSDDEFSFQARETKTHSRRTIRVWRINYAV